MGGFGSLTCPQPGQAITRPDDRTTWGIGGTENVEGGKGDRLSELSEGGEIEDAGRRTWRWARRQARPPASPPRRRAWEGSSSSIWPVAIRITWTAFAMVFVGRFSPLGRYPPLEK